MSATQTNDRPAEPTTALGPLRVFRIVAVAEAMTWAGLLVGMFLKRVTDTTDLGVTIFGPIHGVAFLAYVLVTVAVAVDQRWSVGRTLLGLAAALPPFFTVAFDAYAERSGLLGTSWQSRADSASRGQRAVCWLLRNKARALVVFVVALAVLTTAALVAGPPVG